MEKGSDRELPMRIQTVFLMPSLDKKKASMGEISITKVDMQTPFIACDIVKPCLWNGFHTKHMNLSSASRQVAALDAWMETTIIVPIALQSTDFFQNRAT